MEHKIIPTDTMTKEDDLTVEEIESYGICAEGAQPCMMDCPWPFSGAYISSVD